MTPARKRNGQLACGCRPYDECEDPEDFHLCREGRRLYKRMMDLPLWTDKGKAAMALYLEHVGRTDEQSVQPEDVAA